MTSKQNRNRGKAVERAIAKLLNGKRVGLFGGEDIQHPLFSVEVKSRKAFVARGWMEQCEANNRDNKIPLLVVHETGRRHENDFVILKMSDFIQNILVMMGVEKT